MDNNKIKILAIEDEIDNLTVINSVLEAKFPNAKLLTAINGKIGLEIASTETPDVIFLGNMLQGIPGVEICRRIKSNEGLKDISVVFLMPLEWGKDNKASALTAGADAFLATPIDESELIAQVRAMVKIRKSEERYRLIAENVSEVIWVLNLSKSKLTYVSPSIKQLRGISVEEALQEKLEDALEPESFSKIKEIIHVHLEDFQKNSEHNRYYNIEVKQPCKNGGYIWVELTGRYRYNSEGELEVVGTSRCIEERKRVETKLLSAKQQSEAANYAKSRFLANMSHEIRTPMNGIMGFLYFLENSSTSNEQREYINNIKISSESLLTIINDILDYTKIESDKLTLEHVQFDLQNEIQNVIETYSVIAKEKGNEIGYSGAQDIPRFYIGDPSRLKQIIGNLLSNAVKFTEHGRIEVIATLLKLSGKSVEINIAVKDTGIGMTEQEADHIFQPFHQVDTSLTRRYGGTGLGLTISKRLIELMGGTIHIKSNKGLGTMVNVCLSLEIADGKLLQENNVVIPLMDNDIYISNNFNEKASSSVPGETGRKDVRILVVEDNDINKKFIVKLLTMQGCQIETANNGLEAINLLQDKEYHIVFMDCQMPGMDGFEATRRIRKNECSDKHTTIIAMTAYAMAGDREKCMEAGMDDYISKPINNQQLFQLLHKYTSISNKADNDGSLLYKLVARMIANSDFDQEFCENLILDYCTEVELMLTEIKENLFCSKINECKQLLHRLKGASGSVYAEEIFKMITDAEEAAVNSEIDVIMVTLYKIHTFIDNLKGELQSRAVK